jgi:hypothetical protein
MLHHVSKESNILFTFYGAWGLSDLPSLLSEPEAALVFSMTHP